MSAPAHTRLLGSNGPRMRTVGLGTWAIALADALRPVAERHDVSVATVAIAWTLAQPGVTGAIVGARSADQIDDWIAAGSLALDKDDLSDLQTALHQTQAGNGPIPS